VIFGIAVATIVMSRDTLWKVSTHET
jgi:hypothetical protein